MAAGQLDSGDIYLSDRLLSADEELPHLLAESYAEGYMERWVNGTYFSNWAPMNPVRQVDAVAIQSGPQWAHGARADAFGHRRFR